MKPDRSLFQRAVRVVVFAAVIAIAFPCYVLSGVIAGIVEGAVEWWQVVQDIIFAWEDWR